MRFIGGGEFSDRSFQNMADNDELQELRNLDRAFFDLAKVRYREAILIRLLIFIISLTSIIYNFMTTISLLFVLILSGYSEFLIWRSNIWKSKADSLLGKLDFMDSLSWSISRSEISDLVVGTPDKIEKKLKIYNHFGDYFASVEPIGPKRAIENIQESAWWSKNLANQMMYVCIFITIFMFLTSVFLLIFSIYTIKDFDSLYNMARASISTIMLIFSFGFIPISIGYYNFSKNSSDIENRAEQIIERNNISEIDAIKIIHSYQMARVKSPLIPTCIWKLKRNKLNQVWEKYRKRN